MEMQLWGGRALARRRRSERGQALLEFTACFFVLLTMVFGLIDVSRILHDKQVMSGLTRQGSNLASRGTSLQDTVTSLVTQGSSLNLGTEGRVIVTSVAEGSNGSPEITAQVESTGGIAVTSSIGSGVGKPATVPAAANPVLQKGQTIYVTEVFYTFQAVTPIGSILKLALPTTLYEAAYF
jgi:Flp pilus assembly protein TadG